VVHADADFLADIEGELRESVVDELNVQQLDICSDPMQYATVYAEPNFAVLGKRLGKNMGITSKAIKGMSQADIATFQKDGRLVIEGHELHTNDIIVRHEFKAPCGVGEDEIDAALGEDGIMVVMELKVDDTLMDAGTAREMVNRVQKLRKSSGLKESDVVAIYYDQISTGSQNTDDGFLRALRAQDVYLKQCFGNSPRPMSARPSHAVVLAQDIVQLSSGVACRIILATPAIKIDNYALLKACGGVKDLADAVHALLVSREPAELAYEAQRVAGIIKVSINDSVLTLTPGIEVWFP